MVSSWSLLLLLLLSALVAFSVAESEAMVSIKPGKPGVASVSLDDFHCRFEYDVTGGTKEEWELFVEEVEEGSFACTAGRPRSYLYFRHWKITVSEGYRLFFQQTEVENNGASLSGMLQYDPSGVVNNVIESSDTWEGNMSGVYVVAIKEQKGDL
eukprot:TRINITY_DN7540_c0_g1_i1.p2 TRINITY_DN7540_c0_g1~~TRINITY_DN7540_c0_g1_i1.p2  ORF type:complete len:155 (-),score=48.65 TRINITY_DN7540_c0_g1_i1:155-619(-)